jgi:negative regulator of flagellin synthesis FlgM
MSIRKILDGLQTYDQAKIDKGKTARAGAASGQDAGAARTEAASGDKVSLSPEAKLAGVALGTAQAAPDVRRDRVEAIKARIADGTYAVDSKKIAEKLVGEDLDIYG